MEEKLTATSITTDSNKKLNALKIYLRENQEGVIERLIDNHERCNKAYAKTEDT